MKTNATQTQLDTFTRAYIECALWSSTDDESNPLDANYSIFDLAPEALERVIADCQRFQHENPAKLDYVSSICDDSRAGHNLWLNRNGHGSGFWDEYFGEDAEMRRCFVSLSDAAKLEGTCDLYVGDDGQLYLS